MCGYIKLLLNGINIVDVLLLLVSSFAIVQYLLQRRQARKSAATNVYVQLKEFDNYIMNIRSQMNEDGHLADFHFFSLNVAFSENQWDKNKHLLINKLNQDDITLINRAYETVESIERAREKIVEMFLATNNAKTSALQFKIIEKIINCENKESIKQLSFDYDNCGYTFSSRTPYDAFYSKVQQYKNVVGTTTLNKLKKLSYQDSKK